MAVRQPQPLGMLKSATLQKGDLRSILKAVKPYRLIPVIEEGKRLTLIDRKHGLQYCIEQVDRKTIKIDILGYRNDYRQLQRFGEVQQKRHKTTIMVESRVLPHVITDLIEYARDQNANTIRELIRRLCANQISISYLRDES